MRLSFRRSCACCSSPSGAGGGGPIATRRSVLGAAAAATLLPVAAAARVQPGGSSEAPPVTDVIDVHHHIVPPAFMEAVPDLPDWIRAWRPEHSIEAMDRTGVAAAVTSINAPGLILSDPQAARRVSRLCNEFAARMAADHPGRFATFCTLAPMDTDGALAEAVHALDVLGCEGVGLMTSYGRTYLASERFHPLFEELDRRAAIVFVHPTFPDIGRDLDPPIDPLFLEMPFDTARTLLAMLVAGTFERFPSIRFIFNHGGGGLPVLHRRLALAFGMNPALRDRFPNGVIAPLANVYFDTVNVLNAPNFAMLRQLFALDRLMFGTDAPGFAPEINLEPLRALPVAEAQAIGRDTALGLFPGLAASRAVRSAS